MVPGISNHQHSKEWQPGNGGLCLHTILRDGDRVHLGISTGGHYVSNDGGRDVFGGQQGVGAGFAPDPYPEFGQCVHKIAGHPDAPGRLYMQNHGGWGDWDGPGGPTAGNRRAAQRRLSVKRGTPSPMGCHPISAFRSWCIRMIPTWSTFCRWNR